MPRRARRRAVSGARRQPVAVRRHAGSDLRIVLRGRDAAVSLRRDPRAGRGKGIGSLRLLVQLPYRPAMLIAVKLAAVLAAWFACAVPALSALAIWLLSAGISPRPRLEPVFGHLLYGVLIGAIALFAAAVTESGATAAIVTLAFTIGSWVLDFTLAGRSGLLEQVAGLSLTQVVRGFEQGLLAFDLVAGVLIVAAGFAASPPSGCRPECNPTQMDAPVALSRDRRDRARGGIPDQATRDVSEDQRNSFSPADQAQLATIAAPLAINVHLAPEDPRYVDLRRNVLAKLDRVMPQVAIRLDTERRSFARRPATTPMARSNIATPADRTKAARRVRARSCR